MATDRKPWEKPKPKKARGKSTKLTPSQKAEAKRSADKAGREYPNLVDNMRVAARSRENT